MRHLIIGAGPAGVRAAEALRREVPGHQVTLINGEASEPYARMAIPYILSGRIDEPGAYQRKTPGHFDSLGIDYRRNRVEQVEPSATGGSVRLDDGSVLPYDRLLVATGSSPALPPIPGTELEGVVSCWTLDDARAIAARIRPGAKVVLLGAGFVAGVCMKALVARGVELSIIAGRSGQILRSMMTPVGSQMLQRWLEHKGVRVISEGRSERIEPGPKLVMSNQTLEADLIILATGVRPNVSFLEGTGARIDQGIVVDAHMRTSVPHIYAAGDVAQGRDFSTGEWVVHALQPTATEHGRVAALNMAGRTQAYRGSLSMNVLDTAGLISHTFGIWQGVNGGEVVESVDEANFRYIRLCFDGEHLVGAILIGNPDHAGAARGLIQSRRALGDWRQHLKDHPEQLMAAFVGLTTGR